MDATLPTGLLPSSEFDVPMVDGDPSLINGTNGTLDPRVLNQIEDQDMPDSTPEEFSREVSEPSSEPTSPPNGRRYQAPTGCCYDARMKLHANADFSSSPHHPEDPRRIEAIFAEFRKAGLIYMGGESELRQILKESPNKFMHRISARRATEPEICLVHTAAHFEWVMDLSNKSSDELRTMTNVMDNGRKSLYVGNLTNEAALLSAGGAIESCKNVVAGVCKNAIAVIRPPGHHAEHNESMGFCIFNNVPIAASVCMQDYPETCRKILILDWDVHHGNGIQNMFWDNPNVLYISIHVYQDGNFYPGQPEDGGPDGGLDQVGVGKGEGKNVNIGWIDQGMGDGDYMAAFQKIVMPIAQEFDPDLVIVSAGFDAAQGDDLGGCYVTPACYSHMTHMLMSLADGKVVVCLEGGYNLRAISKSAVAVAKTLMGEPPERLGRAPGVSTAALHVLHEVKLQQAPYWECMRKGTVVKKELVETGAIRLDNVLRAYQRKILNTEFKMVSLYVQRTLLSRTFDDQVLVTPGIYSAKKIVLIIHDPPEVLATADPVSGQINTTNAHMTDPLLPYIRRFIQLGYGIVDVNIPAHILSPTLDPGSTNTPAYIPKPKTLFLEQQTKELLCYLWDNYLEGYSSRSIVLMGVGEAYLGVKQLLTSRDCRYKISQILSFVSGALRPIKSETDPHLSQWYKQNSLIYVSPDHACWSDEDAARKVRKNRFGGVVQAEVSGLGAMLGRYLVEATTQIDRRTTERLATLTPEDPDETDDDDLMPFHNHPASTSNPSHRSPHTAPSQTLNPNTPSFTSNSNILPVGAGRAGHSRGNSGDVKEKVGGGGNGGGNGNGGAGVHNLLQMNEQRRARDGR